MSDLKTRILESVADDLVAIEAELKANLNPNLELVAKVAEHILFSGGKRLRPLLMVLSARICGYQGTYDKTFSTIFEYLHAATLLHDDLVDDAQMRRNQPVAHSIWGNETAALVGDFLLARGLSIAAETEKPRVIKVIANITENMSQGEIDQLQHKGRIDLTEFEYMEVIRRKTAVLFEGACRISAIIADADQDKEDALSTYGFNLGMAFQMADDLLDYTQDSKALGKTVGADLKEGKLTLPVIYALAAAESNDRAVMEKMITNEFSEDEFKLLIDFLDKYGGVTYTQTKAAAHIDKAKHALAVFEPSETKDILLDVADYALSRKV